MIWVGLAHNYRGNVPFYFISAKFCGACPVQGAYFRIILLTSHMARYRRIWLNTVLSAQFGIQIDWWITTAHHGKDLVDALAGLDKFFLRNGMIDGLDSVQRDEDFQKLSQSDKAVKFLMNVDRGEGDTKHKARLDGKDVKSRTYETSDYDDVDKIPVANCTYKAGKGFDKGKAGTAESKKNGIREMNHFRYHPLLDDRTVAVRRVACMCDPCKKQLMMDWDHSIPKQAPELQPMFKNVPDCEFAGPMGDLNKWHFHQVIPATKTIGKGKDKRTVPLIDEEEVTVLMHNALTSLATEISSHIKKKGFGAISADYDDHADGYHVVEWTGEPYHLQEATRVEGVAAVDGEDEDGFMPAGTLVCEGIYWDRMYGSPGWYEPPRNDSTERPKRLLFFMNHVLDGDLNPRSPEYSRGFQPKTKVSQHNRPNKYRLKFLDEWRRKDLKAERMLRDKLEYNPGDLEGGEEAQTEEDDWSECTELNEEE